MSGIRGKVGIFASLACLLVLLPAGAVTPVSAGDRAPGARQPGFRHHPKVELVVEGDAVYRMLPPDAIAAIDQPVIVPASEVVDLMADDEPVLAVFDGVRARAWSIWMLDVREVVNDRLGDTPIAATWCPLANTGAVYERRVDGEETTFGVSGTLWRDALVLFDRKTTTLWSQVTGRAIHGPLRGRQLSEIPSITTTWGAWKLLHPETEVMRPDEDSRSGSPFAGYFADPDRFGLTRSIKPDRRLPGKSLVIGIRHEDSVTAVSLERLSDLLVVQGQVGLTPVAILSVALYAGFGYDRRVSGRTLDFEADPAGGIRDLQTGSSWDPESGRSVAGPLSGETLRRVDSRKGYWFTWAAFHPATEILEQSTHCGNPLTGSIISLTDFPKSPEICMKSPAAPRHIACSY